MKIQSMIRLVDNSLRVNAALRGLAKEKEAKDTFTQEINALLEIRKEIMDLRDAK